MPHVGEVSFGGGLVLLYERAGDLQRMLAKHYPDLDVEVHRTKQGFLSRRRAARLVVIALGKDFDAGELALLRLALAQAAFGQVVVVAQLSAHAVRKLTDIDSGLRCVVWTDELPNALLPHMERAFLDDVLTEFVDQVREASAIAPVIASAISRTVRTLPPPRSVRAMAHAESIPESTFGYQWRQSLSATPWEFLRWVRLLRGARIRLGDARAAAVWLGIDERTLRKHIVEVLAWKGDPAFPSYQILRAQFVRWSENALPPQGGSVRRVGASCSREGGFCLSAPRTIDRFKW